MTADEYVEDRLRSQRNGLFDTIATQLDVHATVWRALAETADPPHGAALVAATYARIAADVRALIVAEPARTPQITEVIR